MKKLLKGYQLKKRAEDNLISGLIAYTYLPKKPSLNLHWYDQNLPVVTF